MKSSISTSSRTEATQSNMAHNNSSSAAVSGPSFPPNTGPAGLSQRQVIDTTISQAYPVRHIRNESPLTGFQSVSGTAPHERTHFDFLSPSSTSYFLTGLIPSSRQECHDASFESDSADHGTGKAADHGPVRELPSVRVRQTASSDEDEDRVNADPLILSTAEEVQSFNGRLHFKITHQVPPLGILAQTSMTLRDRLTASQVGTGGSNSTDKSVLGDHQLLGMANNGYFSQSLQQRKVCA